MTDQSIAFDQCVSSINVMLTKERTVYEVPDYLRHLRASVYGDFPVDALARDVIVDWFVKIVTLCNYSSETAAIATSILDRFAASDDSKDILAHRENFQLASLTAIYTAVKVHEREVISPAFVAKLSGGLSSVEDIEKMEIRMLKALQWRVNPPTAEWFFRSFLDLVLGSRFDAQRMSLMELGRLQVTFSLLDYDFCTFRASDIALASLLNAVEGIFGDQFCTQQLEAAIHTATNIKATHSLDRLRTRLCGATYHDAVSKIKGARKSKHDYLQANVQRKLERDVDTFSFSNKRAMKSMISKRQ
jgi:hypothetical protein